MSDCYHKSFHVFGILPTCASRTQISKEEEQGRVVDVLTFSKKIEHFFEHLPHTSKTVVQSAVCAREVPSLRRGLREWNGVKEFGARIEVPRAFGKLCFFLEIYIYMCVFVVFSVM